MTLECFLVGERVINPHAKRRPRKREADARSVDVRAEQPALKHPTCGQTDFRRFSLCGLDRRLQN
jgi:hypothetical protein